MNQYPHHKSSIANMDANLMAMLLYVLPMIFGFLFKIQILVWVFPLIVFFMEKNSEFVKFHAAQSLGLAIISAVYSVIMSVIIAILGLGSFISGMLLGSIGDFFSGGITGIIAVILGIGAFILSLVLFVFKIIAAVKSYNNYDYHIPFIGNIAEKFVNSTH